MEAGSIREQLYIDFHDKVFSYVYQRVRSREDAEDLTGDIFLKVYDKLDTYDNTKAAYSTWIYQITRNSVIDYYRRYKMTEEVPEELSTEKEIDEELLNDETLGELAEALKSLPEEQRDIIINRYYHGYTLQEISEMMSLSYGVTKLRHKEALFTLRSFLNRA
ncbi:MAG TPA: hypothetical protein DCL38_01495 [Lachnospiraceae bacterium]|nr:hypothetical protein [Lachnospiraceae bacterium]